MTLPVTVTGIRLAIVATLGALVISFAWDIIWLFVAVAIGLIIVGVGQALCLLGPGWRARAGIDVKPAGAPGSRH